MSDTVIRVLEKELAEKESRLEAIEHKIDINALSKAAYCYDRSNAAFSRFIMSGQKDATALNFANAWNEAKKKYAKIAKDQADNGDYVDERVALEFEIYALKNEIFSKRK